MAIFQLHFMVNFRFTAALDLDFKTTAHLLKLHEDGRYSGLNRFQPSEVTGRTRCVFCRC